MAEVRRQGDGSLPPELVHGDLVDVEVVEVRVIGPAGPARAVLDRVLAALDTDDVSGPIPARGTGTRFRWYIRQAVPRE